MEQSCELCFSGAKGRDLFDLALMKSNADVDESAVVNCFNEYLRQSNQHITRAMFEANLAEKAEDRVFRGDIVDEIYTLIEKGPVDILLTHDAPSGVLFPRHRQGHNWTRSLDRRVDCS